jgi:hypothetical protein
MESYTINKKFESLFKKLQIRNYRQNRSWLSTSSVADAYHHNTIEVVRLWKELKTGSYRTNWRETYLHCREVSTLHDSFNGDLCHRWRFYWYFRKKKNWKSPSRPLKNSLPCQWIWWLSHRWKICDKSSCRKHSGYSKNSCAKISLEFASRWYKC